MSSAGERFQEFRRLWTEAEARLKRTEHVSTLLIVPAVNELRYAGYHLLLSLAEEDQVLPTHKHRKAQCSE